MPEPIYFQKFEVQGEMKTIPTEVLGPLFGLASEDQNRSFWIVLFSSRSMASNQKTLLFDDVAGHNKNDDCWLIISGKIF